MKEKIKISGLSKKLGGRMILNGLDLTIYEGETFVLLGQSGIGKSVLLKHIIGLFLPDKGKIYIDSELFDPQDPKSLKKVRKKCGMLFQGGALFDSLSVGENITFALDHLRPDLSQEEKQRKVQISLDLVELEGKEDLPIASLSGGMMKRVALARAIVAEPEIVLFDEPTTGLDPIMVTTIDELILSIKRKLNTTFVVVTHDLYSARSIADRVGLIFNGRIVFTGSAPDIEKSENPYIHQFVNGIPSGPLTA
ncbi:MAG: ATP-binding cassette domain-containing protein [Spirochaetales bacterium]|nr:ATP-binding cassette domain-containing protein [Spirochaetales bacterium]